MQYVRRFSELGMDDVAIVGGKNASLGEMVTKLGERGVQVPDGFATTADAYRHYIRHNGLDERIREALSGLDTDDVAALESAGRRIREWVSGGEMPEDLAEEIAAAYRELGETYGENPDVAVRSSATAEDLPSASFAGQQESYLNISGEQALLDSVRHVFASLFTDRAISYRVHQGFDHMAVALSAGVQKMVRADLASSGVMFSIDTESGFADAVFITAAWGLGENVVQGAVNPDEFYVFKPTLERDFRPIISRQLGDKAMRMIYTDDARRGASTRNVDVPPEDRRRFAITDDEVLTLARYAVEIEKHYSGKAGETRPMDIEWAKDGESGELFILQARPETVHSQREAATHATYNLEERGEVLVEGKSVGERIASGRARIVASSAEMGALDDGDILITDMTDPDWEPIMKRAGAIVTNRGGRTCHAAIIARELGIPAIVGCGDATERVPDGEQITVSCAEGSTGYVYRGQLPFTVERLDAGSLETARTDLMINLGNPEQAFRLSFLPAAGVGLARLEFIINNRIGIHPRALLEYDQLDAETRAVIDERTAGFDDRREFYVRRLAEGVGTIAAAFYPRPVVVRLSDFKSNEYAAMIGGEGFEPTEENPMLGFRGASRYYAESFSPSFALECEALRRVREEMGLSNARVMLPFVRSVEEVDRVLELMADNGLARGKNGLEVYLMCEIPANALLADEFLEHVDGFSIGSNDLTQLTLGVDRDSSLIEGLDERNPAVKKLMAMAIESCRRHGKYVGICGQAPSDFPEISRWLVEQGISSLSLNPDSLLPMQEAVLEAEKAMSS
ncbi:MAG: phosphoenolpyruvate synthase [Guyparkeria sp.]|uniref:phosphoenolpyruvate synthase n=2 Tax=Guyparkeria sp. TaxID=2035736 RepID=UPI00397B78F0